MSEEKKSTYTEARKRANEKYLKESVEDIRIRVRKGQKEVIKHHAEGQGESLNGFVVRSIDETIKRDNKFESYKKLAKAKGESLNQYIMNAVKERVRNDKARNAKAKEARDSMTLRK